MTWDLFTNSFLSRKSTVIVFIMTMDFLFVNSCHCLPSHGYSCHKTPSSGIVFIKNLRIVYCYTFSSNRRCFVSCYHTSPKCSHSIVSSPQPSLQYGKCRGIFSCENDIIYKWLKVLGRKGITFHVLFN